jgi:hypothetical protein
MPSDTPAATLHTDVVVASEESYLGESVQIKYAFSDQDYKLNRSQQISSREDIGVFEKHQGFTDGLQAVLILVA